MNENCTRHRVLYTGAATCPDCTRIAGLETEVSRLSRLLNTPEIHDFTKAVTLEAAHQRERWGASHDGGKTDADWFWLIGYLAGKAIRPDTDKDKKLHRIITVAAAACNWHAAVAGTDNTMRPGTLQNEEKT